MPQRNALEGRNALGRNALVTTVLQEVHRSHFGSRYRMGCCDHAGLFEGVQFPALGFLLFVGLMSLRHLTWPGKKAGSTLRTSQAVPHPSTNRALCRLTSEVGRDPVHSTRYGRQRALKSRMYTRAVRSRALRPSRALRLGVARPRARPPARSPARLLAWLPTHRPRRTVRPPFKSLSVFVTASCRMPGTPKEPKEPPTNPHGTLKEPAGNPLGTLKEALRNMQGTVRELPGTP